MTTIQVRKLTTDVKNSIKDCVISLFYRKKDLIQFLKDCNFTTLDLKGISEDQTKSNIIDTSLANISLRQDQGALQVRSLTEAILGWSDFNSYWFKNGSLSREAAQESIENFKRILGEKTNKEIDDQKIRERKEYVLRQKEKTQTLEDLNNKFSELTKMSNYAQKRGYELETLLVKLFGFFDISVDPPFKLTGEQIDGSFNFLGNNYIFEAKWQDMASAIIELYSFTYKIESNTLYPRGIFLSINGYTTEAIKRITHNKKPQLVLLDSLDLIHVLEGRISLGELLTKKIKHAQTRGEIYVNISQLD